MNQQKNEALVVWQSLRMQVIVSPLPYEEKVRRLQEIISHLAQIEGTDLLRRQIQGDVAELTKAVIS